MVVYTTIKSSLFGCHYCKLTPSRYCYAPLQTSGAKWGFDSMSITPMMGQTLQSNLLTKEGKTGDLIQGIYLLVDV